jgi:hypothetical protein
LDSINFWEMTFLFIIDILLLNLIKQYYKLYYVSIGRVDIYVYVFGTVVYLVYIGFWDLIKSSGKYRELKQPLQRLTSFEAFFPLIIILLN